MKIGKIVIVYAIHTECVTDLDYQSEMIIFCSILTTLESSSIF
jgi:hypothetical protein